MDAKNEAAFVARAIKACQSDNGAAARLRRADNPATEPQSWDLLAGLGVDLDREAERLAHASIGAFVARAGMEENGRITLGQGIAACYDDGNKSDQAKARLRRILACSGVPELCRILRPTFSLMISRGSSRIDCVLLLTQMRRFGIATGQGNQQWVNAIKAQWAQEFYTSKNDEVGAMEVGS